LVLFSWIPGAREVNHMIGCLNIEPETNCQRGQNNDDFVELKNSAGALVVAILEPVEFRLSACPPKKAAQVYHFPPKKGSIPHSLH
jgi:hypothetical protein